MSTHVLIPYDNHAGLWSLYQQAIKPSWALGRRNGVVCAFLVCQCGTRAPLQPTHTVADNGVVSPSVVCDCGYHEHIVLQNYQAICSPAPVKNEQAEEAL